MAPSKISLPNARPYAFTFPVATTALIIIDMQRDFVDPNGFGSIQCGNPEIFASVRTIVPTLQKVLETCRSAGIQVIHTREGHQPDLSDLPPSKKLRQISAPGGHHTMGIGDQGPMGRLLVRGEWGHDIIDELRQLPGEPVIDKPGKGSYWGTGLHRILLARGITHLLFSGVTTECCVTTTLRECNDRGFECCILSDCTGGFDQQMVTTSLDIICGQDGLFGYIGHSSDFFASISKTLELTPPPTPPATEEISLSIEELHRKYKNGLLNPETVVDSVFNHIEDYEKSDSALWISKVTREEATIAVNQLSEKFAGKPLPPLFGIPFALKDNIDLEDVVTTAACEKFAYTAKTTAPAVQLLLDAGAIYIGKLNMDQLATGLSGCRSPYGTPHSFPSKDHISGGSSSGSAVAVAAGLVSFTLGTDTAGSGRVPAAFNGIVGFKPTKGTISARGVVPACKSLDTLSIFAKSLSDARKVWYIIDKYDSLDPYAKVPQSLSLWKSDFRGPKEGGFTFGIPATDASLNLINFCEKSYRELFHQATKTLLTVGGKAAEIDYTPFTKGADLLYDASLVHERISSIGYDFLSVNMESLHPTTKSLFESALSSPLKPWNVFHDQACQKEYTMQAHKAFNQLEGGIDVLVLPTAPFHPTIKEMEADPLALNAKIGVFTHAANVLDLCAVSVNAGWYEADGVRLPFGLMFVGGSGMDGRLLDIAQVFEEAVRSKEKAS